jgi:hypothetical protein
MLKALLLVLALQDPKPKTVEDRLTELDAKLSALEKRQSQLLDENATMEKKLADAKAWREKAIVQTADFWVKRYSSTLALTEKQTTEIRALWVAWTREAYEKRIDDATWKARESTLRAALTAEQIPLLEKSVRTEMENGAKTTIESYGKQAQIAPERSEAFVKAVMNRLTIEEAGLIPQAHPGAWITWTRVLAAIEAAGPDLAAILTPEEQERLAKVKAQWKSFREK